MNTILKICVLSLLPITANAQIVLASMYGNESGSVTASGQKFIPSKHTAAHRTYKFGTKLKVTNLKNHKSVIVTINDRGPYISGRSIDLSTGSAKAIGFSGVGKVEIVKIL